jgi:16S rRNA (guanine(966)-N(2))-methyltransferase RsmD
VPRQAPSQVRIIGGRWKRTLLPVPDAQGLRPTPDRVRETLFNWLGQDLSGLTCLDLFAGSGALGFEAASRGAAAVTLVEANPRVARQLRDNQYRLDASQIRVVQGDAFALAAQMPDASFDVIFLDPPFAEDWLRPALEHAARLSRPGGAVYVETDRTLTGADAPVPASLEIVRQARAGAVYFHLLQHRAAPNGQG